MFIRQFFTLLLLFLLAGCMSIEPIGNPEAPYPLDHPAVGDLVHLATGHKIDQAQMLDAIGDTRIIYVGETHDNPAAHQWQLSVLKGLYHKNPQNLALAMEMFNPEQQAVLDRWSAGKLTEKEFLRQVGWFKNWRMNYALYRPLLSFCREKHIPVIGLNAPKALVHKVDHTALSEMSKELRAKLPELDFSDPYQRAMTSSIYGGHIHGKAMLDSFIRVQTLWDEAMAQNLALYLRSPAGKDRQIVVAAGGNHIRYGFGIPRRLHRRLPLSYLLIGSREIEIPKERKAQLMDVQMPQFPMRGWDYLKLTRYEKITSGVKLGIAIEKAPQGIAVKRVMPDSPAEKAGLKQGDLLLQGNQTKLQKPFDLLYLLMNMLPDEELSLQVKRAEKSLTLKVDFQPQA